MAIIVQAITYLLGLFRAALPWIAGAVSANVGQLFLSMGFGVVSFAGFDRLISYFMDIAINSLTGLGDVGYFGADIVNLLGYMWLDKALNLLCSSAVALLVIKGVRGGVLTRQVWYKPGSKTGGMEG